MDREPKKARPDDDVTGLDGDGGVDDDGIAPGWVFSCICGKYGQSSYPASLAPEGDQFECVSCRKWQHTNCYVEYEDCDALPELMYCKSCSTTERSPLFALSTPIVSRILTFVDFPTRLNAALVSQGTRRAARSAQRRLEIKHKSPDVVVRLLHVFDKLDVLTLYCWSQRLAKWLPGSLESLTVVSAAPNLQLGGVPRTLSHFALHDVSVGDTGVSAMLSRGDKTFTELRSLDLSCTSVTSDVTKFVPPYVQRLLLCATPLADVNFPRNLMDLTELDLSHTFVTDDVLQKLPPNLAVVNFSHTKITPEALLTEFVERRARRLRLVMFQGNAALTEAQRARIPSSMQVVP